MRQRAIRLITRGITHIDHDFQNDPCACYHLHTTVSPYSLQEIVLDTYNK